MASTNSIVIFAVIVGIIILGGLWAWSRSRMPGDVPPAKVEDRVPVIPAPLTVPEPVVKLTPEPVAKVVTKVAPKRAAATPKAPAAKKPVAEKPIAKKAAVPKKAAPKPVAAPKTAPLTAIGVPGAVGAPDSLLQLKGVGPKLNTLLGGLGIARFDQIAAWSAEDVAKVDEHLGAFKGRIERDSWIEQAGFLAKGAIAEFETKFGKLDSENK